MSLRVWLPLDGDLRNQGISEITFSGTSTWQSFGKIGSKAYNLSTRTSFNCPALANVKYFSVAFWCMIEPNTESTANWMDILSLTDKSTNDTTGYFRFETGYENTAYGGVHWHDNATNAIINGAYIYNTASEQNQWHHIVVTVSNTAVCSYYDGVLKQTNTSNLGGGHLTGAGWIGESTTRGSIQDVRIYDHCLSAAEVKEIAQGLILHYKLDMPQLNNSTILTSEISNTAYNSSLGKYGYNNDSNLAKTSGTFQGKNCVKISTITAGQNAQPYVYFSNLFTSNGANQPAYKKLIFEYYTTCPTTTWLNIYKLGSGTGTVSWKTINSKGIHNGMYTNSESGHNLLVEPNEWNYVEVILNGDTDANAEWGYCINGPTHTSNANYYFLYANIRLEASNQLKIQDSSGYNHNGVGIGNLKNTSDTKRYDSSIKWNSSDPTTNNNTSLCYVQTPLSLTTPLQLSFTWWGKPESGYGDNTGHAVFCTSNSDTAPTDYNTTAFHHRDSGFDIYPSDGSGAKRLSFSYTKNEWHHYAVTYDGTTARTYQDGVLKTSIEVGANKTLASFSQLYIGFSKAGGVWRKTLGSYSDFRVYVTQLLDTDIKQLYNVGMKIDKLGNMHPFELEENIGMVSNVKFVNNSANSVTYDATTDTYTIVSKADTSSWGYGVRLADDPPLWVPYGATYRWTAEVWTPIALSVNTDYNNTTGSADTNWAGNDNDATGTRLAAGVSIPANTWTRIYRGASNTNNGNTNHLPIRDYSSLGLVTNGQSEPVTWKVRHLQWYLIDTDFKPQLKKTGIFKSSHFTETEEDLNKPVQLNKKMFSTNATQFIER